MLPPVTLNQIFLNPQRSIDESVNKSKCGSVKEFIEILWKYGFGSDSVVALKQLFNFPSIEEDIVGFKSTLLSANDEANEQEKALTTVEFEFNGKKYRLTDAEYHPRVHLLEDYPTKQVVLELIINKDKAQIAGLYDGSISDWVNLAAGTTTPTTSPLAINLNKSLTARLRQEKVQEEDQQVQHILNSHQSEIQQAKITKNKDSNPEMTIGNYVLIECNSRVEIYGAIDQLWKGKTGGTLQDIKSKSSEHSGNVPDGIVAASLPHSPLTIEEKAALLFSDEENADILKIYCIYQKYSETDVDFSSEAAMDYLKENDADRKVLQNIFPLHCKGERAFAERQRDDYKEQCKSVISKNANDAGQYEKVCVAIEVFYAALDQYAKSTLPLSECSSVVMHL